MSTQSNDQHNPLRREDILSDLETRESGLTSDEVRQRLAQYGPNVVEEKKTSAIVAFLSHFWGPIPWMIEIAIILSAIVHHWADFGIIMVLLFANAIVGFWEEFQAGNAIEALKSNLAIKARALRDGKWGAIPASELVPGDIVRLRLGDIIPADVLLMGEDPVEVDQSALTGESMPVKLGMGEKTYSGSIIKRGDIQAAVFATGSKTYFGKTAELVESAHTVSHFQKAVLRIGRYLIILAIILVALIIGVAVWRGDPFITTLQFALVLTVAAIPVAMPTVLSVTMAVGARKLAKKQAIVSRLVAIEELAGMDMLCSDKTGTLTQNKLSVGEPFAVGDATARDILLGAALASQAEDQDAIDMAVLESFNDDETLKRYKRLHYMPFDPVGKRTEATLSEGDGPSFKTSKGAPQVILALDDKASSFQKEVEEKIDDFAKRGYRALGVARTDADGVWHFLGVLPLSDPPREDSKATITTARDMGITVKMVTGDQAAIGKEIARRIGMGDNILNADLFDESNGADEKTMTDEVENADGFAQVFPEHKFKIVELLQKRGHITGMTGDGVNDAPALKKADTGIAVSGATDAARAAADIVLLTPGLSVIIDAIKESRKIFQHMNSYATYRIAETIRVLLFMTLSILVLNFYPVTAVMIVLLALLNDGAILSIAYDRVHYSPSPEAWEMKDLLIIATVLGVIGVVASFGFFYLVERIFHLDRDMIQTLMYLKLSVAGQLTIFLTRTRSWFFSSRPATALILAVAIAQTIATLFSVFGWFMAPIGWRWALVVWGYAISWALFNDVVKVGTYKIIDHYKARAKARAVSGAETA